MDALQVELEPLTHNEQIGVFSSPNKEHTLQTK